MIEIGRLRLQLPAGFERRGESIARLVGRALADTPVTDSRRLEQLRIGPLNIEPQQSDASVARQIAVAIHRQLGPQPGRQGD